MPALSEVQNRMRDVILGASAESLRSIVADDRLGHGARLNVYRNNTTILLTDALAANFPIVHQLVGEEFFAALARAFIRTAPPRSPCLFEYGAALPAFLETFPGADGLPYLGDVARLEWAINESLYAANAPALAVDALAHVPPDDYPHITFCPHPAARMVASPYPIHAIWALHQPNADPEARVSLDQGGEAVLITRPNAEVRIQRLPPGADLFVTQLLGGRLLGRAFSSAQRVEPAFDGAAALSIVLSCGALSTFRRC